MKRSLLFAVLIILCVGFTYAQSNNKENNRIKFNPQSDPFKDLQTAVKEAQKVHRNIILDVGGEWCIWCHRLDEFIEGNPRINKLLDSNFITVKVNYSPENKNEKFLSQYPKIEGYPHLFVLSTNGKLLHSQDTGLLEKDKSYNSKKIIQFLKKWMPKY